ncbi:NADPH-dependent 2,4-dienoyl-CoA reductase/sulfur reductase-like enzyme [Entomoplasma freundtii]|uniref:NADH oxidase n=1 Tax=Entomoplasma freundtii TaxID=74700 RepID=A0A2K8NRR5_9MOLU|nr:FAD-dependent oxidoreductase [Entomoplasma freundtii]ATZ16236.1 NADH oxidase [Entomoplasma freundtii]TDY56863.1 NADPH-dependent 2,4-dienoyl-CoA reductase/sulfur reductase-like enzyme [Entomoplasma freundtii]
MKIIVIGTNHAGTTAVRTLKRLNPNNEITTYDRNNKISFLGCGIALWVKGEVQTPEALFYATPEILEEEGINVKMNHDWIGIDAKNKTVTIKNLQTNEIITDNYDKLIVATGSWPIIPPIPGIDQERIQICKNYDHGKIIAEANANPNIKHVTIVGAGYIGVELVDAFISKGKKVSLVDVAPRIMPNYYDAEFTNQIEKERMPAAGVDLHLNEKVIAFKGNNGVCESVVTDKGEIKTDYVIFSVGVKPQTQLLEGVIDLLPNKAIQTNAYLQTSDPDIYAIGDCAAVMNKATNLAQPIQLATTAVRTGIVAAVNITNHNSLAAPAFTGANGIDVFGIKMASTGLTTEIAKRLNIDFDSIVFTDKDRPEFMSSQKDVLLKIIWDKKTREILGAQIASENNHTETMYMFALAIQKGLTIDELPLVDIFFLPHFNKPYNFVTLAGLEVLGLNYFKKEKIIENASLDFQDQ